MCEPLLRVAMGLDDFTDTLDEIEGENSIPVEELFNDSFMRRRTDYDSFEQFIEESEWEVESEEDFEAIPQEDFDAYVDENTPFEDTDDMTAEAGEEWVADQFD